MLSKQEDELRLAILDYLDAHDGDCSVDLAYGIVDIIREIKERM